MGLPFQVLDAGDESAKITWWDRAIPGGCCVGAKLGKGEAYTGGKDKVIHGPCKCLPIADLRDIASVGYPNLDFSEFLKS